MIVIQCLEAYHSITDASVVLNTVNNDMPLSRIPVSYLKK